MLQLVEDDYLGSSGSRGSGRIEFHNMTLFARVGSSYMDVHSFGRYSNINALTDDIVSIRDNLYQLFQNQG